MAPTTLPSPMGLVSLQDTYDAFLPHPSPELREIEKVTRLLGEDIISYSISGSPPRTSSSTTVETMRRTVMEVSVRHNIMFNGMVDRLEPTPDNIEELFNSIAEEIFRDMQYNWGRVVTLYAFAGRLAAHLHEEGHHKCANMMAKIVGDFVTRRLQTWISKSGGWTNFENHFPSRSTSQGSILKGLVVTAMGAWVIARMVSAR